VRLAPFHSPLCMDCNENTLAEQQLFVNERAQASGMCVHSSDDSDSGSLAFNQA
jgi:hypothetical protein